MIQIGTVEKIIDNHQALVKVVRSSACAHDCSECSGCAGQNSVFCVAQNNIYACIGDKVEIESKNSIFFKVIFFVYILPFLMFFVSYFLLMSFSEKLSIIVSSVVFIMTFLSCIFLDKKMRNKQLLIYNIKRIV